MNEPRSQAELYIVKRTTTDGSKDYNISYNPANDLQKWIEDMASYIKSMDPIHLLSTGVAAVKCHWKKQSMAENFIGIYTLATSAGCEIIFSACVMLYYPALLPTCHGILAFLLPWAFNCVVLYCDRPGGLCQQFDAAVHVLKSGCMGISSWCGFCAQQ